jgi:uncharacterized protein YyaL (SSP411 family)
MLAACAEAARVLHRDDYLQLATRNAEFILSTMMKEGRLFRTWKAKPGETKLMGYLEDYAFYADGLLALYQTTFNPRWFQQARALMDVALNHFRDKGAGGFFDTADDHEQLVTRPKNLQDNATPSGNSIAMRVLLQLAAFTGDAKYQEPAVEALAALQEPMAQYPGAFTYWLGNLEFALSDPKEIAIIGQIESDDTQSLVNVAQMPYRPNQVVAVAPEGDGKGHPPLIEGRFLKERQPTAYVCQNFACKQPVTSPAELEKLLAE